MPAPITLNKKRAAVTDHGALYLVLTTTPLTSRKKDNGNDFVQHDAARVQD